MSFLCVSARHELAQRAVPRDANVRPEKRFFPVDVLNKFLDEAAIREILQCACSRCKSHLEDLGKHDPPIKYAKQVAGTRNSTDAKALFALLIYIEHPMFIVAFMERGMSSKNLESWCAEEPYQAESLEKYWPRFREVKPVDSSDLAQKFAFAMHQFAPPRLDHGSFSRYSTSTILPFIQGDSLGSGSYGEVYPFSIYEGYNEIPVLLLPTSDLCLDPC